MALTIERLQPLFGAAIGGVDVGQPLDDQTFAEIRAAFEAPTPEEIASGLIDEYHRALPPDRMPFAYRAADVFIGPTLREEGFGLPTLEALSCGVACLLSDTPGNREIAGEAATYFQEGDAQGLADALPALFTPQARSRARREGPPAAARFEPATVAERLERAFTRALGEAGGPR